MPSGKPRHGPRVRWNDVERDLLLKAAVELLRTNQALTGHELIGKAQISALPAARRRPIHGLNGTELLRKAQRALNAQDGASRDHPPPRHSSCQP
jgi:hypothetical protein